MDNTMSEKIKNAVELIKINGFVTEIEVSIGASIFRKMLKEQLEKEAIECHIFGEEYIDQGWMYSCYESDFIPDFNDMLSHSRMHYLKKRGFVHRGNK